MVGDRVTDGPFDERHGTTSEKDDVTPSGRLPRVVVLDMQPIEPAVGGGRLRLLGLYHDLGLPTTYVGSYDWPGEPFRDHMLSETLREIDVPLSPAHHEAARQISESLGGKTVIDTAFPRHAHLSPEYHETARAEMSRAEIVVFCHPWVYPALADAVDPDRHLVVYDSQNVEGFLRCELLDDDGLGSTLVRDVIATEAGLCRRADLILACSDDDRESYCRLYGVPRDKLTVVPNGTFTSKIAPPTPEQRAAARRRLGLPMDSPIGLFLGSKYPPNEQAMRFIVEELGPTVPEAMFVIAGGVGEGCRDAGTQAVRITGLLSEAEKISYLSACDFAVNPMFSGSGTNIKMFDFMAAGLPVVSTDVGARGIPFGVEGGVFVCTRKSMVRAVGRLIRDRRLRRLAGARSRRVAEKAYSWESISRRLGARLERRFEQRQGEPPRTMAVLSSFGAACGIAEYSNYLSEALRDQVDTLILLTTDQRRSSLQTRLVGADAVVPVWTFDNWSWTDSSVDLAKITHQLREWRPELVNIQYHCAFFAGEVLHQVISVAHNLGSTVSVLIHNAQQMEDRAIELVRGSPAHVFVHQPEEVERLRRLGFSRVSYLPHGIWEIPDEPMNAVRRELGLGNGDVIGCFGFLRPHKGLLELIQAMPLILEVRPEVTLLALNSRYPSPDSEEYERLCRNTIEQMGLGERVSLTTEFVPIEQVIHRLHATDLCVLPYHMSDEAGSGAANICLAARRPLLVSNSRIFSDIDSFTAVLSEVHPVQIAKRVLTLLGEPGQLQVLRKRAEAAIADRGWSEIARRILAHSFEGRGSRHGRILNIGGKLGWNHATR